MVIAVLQPADGVPVGVAVLVAVGVLLGVGVMVGVFVGVAVGGVPVTVGVGVAPAQVGYLNAPMRNCQPTELVVGTHSFTYQKVQSSVGSMFIEV